MLSSKMLMKTKTEAAKERCDQVVLNTAQDELTRVGNGAAKHRHRQLLLPRPVRLHRLPGRVSW